MGTVGLLSASRLIPSSVVAKSTKHQSVLKTLQNNQVLSDAYSACISRSKPWAARAAISS